VHTGTKAVTSADTPVDPDAAAGVGAGADAGAGAGNDIDPDLDADTDVGACADVGTTFPLPGQPTPKNFPAVAIHTPCKGRFWPHH